MAMDEQDALSGDVDSDIERETFAKQYERRHTKQVSSLGKCF